MYYLDFRAYNRSIIFSLSIFLIAIGLAFELNAAYRLPLRFESFSVQDGLPDSDVTAITQDQLGFIWLGTKRGIARYDGQRFYQFRHSPFYAQSLSSNNVTAIHCDPNNAIWVATTSGLNRLDTNSETFTRFLPSRIKDKSQRYSVTALFTDSKKRLWVGSIDGVDRFDPDSQSLQSIKINYDKPGRLVNFVGEVNNKVILGTSHGLFFFDEGKKIFLPIKLNGVNAVGDAYREVRSMLALSKTELLVNMNYALYRVSLARNTADKITIANQRQLLDNLNVYSMMRDHNGIVWLSTSNKGLLLLNVEKKQLQNQNYDADVSGTLLSNTINTSYLSRDNIVWLGLAGGGLQKWLPITEKFQLLSNHVRKEQSLTAGKVNALAEDSRGKIWIGTAEGLTIYDPNKDDYHRLKHLPNMSQSLTEGEVLDIYIDDHPLVWVGTEYGLSLVNAESYAVKQFVNNEYDPQSIPWGSIKSVSGRPGNQLWLVNEVGGLFQFDTKRFKAKQIDLVQGEKVVSGFGSTKMTQQSRYGGEWIVTEAGLIYFEAKSNAKIFITQSTNDDSGLNSIDVSTIYEDSAGGIWIGTQGSGLNYSDNIFSAKRKFTYYDFSTDTKPAKVKGILADSKTALWVATANGLVRFNRVNQTFKHYDKAYGLQGSVFSENAYLLSRDKKIYFGGVNGVTFFKANEIYESRYQPELYITDVKVNEKSLFSPIGSPVFSDIQLTHHDVVLAIHFSLLDFAMPNNSEYQFKMEGQNDVWIDLGRRQEATFMNLASGNYTFTVRARNFEGIWLENTASVNISVAPAWWNSWWAYLIYLTSIIFIAAIFIAERMKKLAAERRVALSIKEREETLMQVLWGSGDEMWDWDIEQGEITRTQPLDSLGYNDDRYLKVHIEDVRHRIHPEDKANVYQLMQGHLQGKLPHFEAIFRVRGYHEEWNWLLSRSRVVMRDSSGRAKRVVGTHKDINNIKSTEDQLRLIAKAFENTSDGVSVSDVNFVNVAVNRAFCEITGYSKDDIIGQPYFFSGINSNNLNEMSEVMEALKNKGSWSGEIIERRKNGDELFIELNIDDVRDSKGNITHYVSVFSDITFRKRVEEDLIRLANYDALTKLPNRTLLKERLAQAIRQSEASGGLVGILFVDLDDFKTINDSLGHSAGDSLLKDVAHRLLSCVNEHDIVSRVGGDEFVLVIQGIHDRDSIVACCERIQGVLKNAFDLGVDHATVSPSIGIAIYPSDGLDVDTLIKHADIAMYHAKGEGKNNFQFFTEEMNRLAIERLNAENSIRMALNKGLFKLFYQAKVNATSLELSGFEALIRWEDPKKGFILPVNFISVAEESGLILELGEWILREACAQLTHWLKINPNIKIAVNLSGRQFQDRNLVQKITAVLKEHAIQPKNIEFEITESILMSDLNYTMKILTELRGLGFTLSLDDFGTGYSSLRYLQLFPVHKIKVDQSFVRDMNTHKGDANIVSTIVNMAHSLSLSVIVEGVESLEQLYFIRDIGGEEIQGYLFAKPVNQEQATVLVEKRFFTLN